MGQCLRGAVEQCKRIVSRNNQDHSINSDLNEITGKYDSALCTAFSIVLSPP